MAAIRVLVVDDSAVIRRLISNEIAADPALQLAGTASNGLIALEMIPKENPDVVTLDVEMPELNGIQTLKILRERYPDLPVIMFSSLTKRCAAITLEALALGASDYVPKPEGNRLQQAMQQVRDELVRKIKAIYASKESKRVDSRASKPPTVLTNSPVALRVVTPPAPTVLHAPPVVPQRRVDLIGIGTSTGGPKALSWILEKLTIALPVPIVIVQHMLPMFTKLLAERLNAICPLSVTEAYEGALLAPGTIWLAPGSHHLLVEREGGQLFARLSSAPPENDCRPAVDVLFRSMAQNVGQNVLGVVLTGMGRDGVRGCERLREIGAHVWAQDEASSVVWGMPGAVVEAQLANRVLPLELLPSEIMRRAMLGRPLPGSR